MLKAVGFSELGEADRWSLEPGSGYYLCRGGRSLIAWRQGHGKVEDHGFRIIAAHTDSPVLKLRPRPGLRVRGIGYLTTEVYGSALLHTWLDRDLKIAGAIYYADATGALNTQIVELADPPVRAMSLAPHLKKERKIEQLTLDLQKDLPVIYAQESDDPFEPLLRSLLGADPDRNILHTDLFLSDTQPSALIGKNKEFISAPRLDNLFSCFASLTALTRCGKDKLHTSVVALYDAEEIGSQTWTGAKSNLLDGTLMRMVAEGTGEAERLLRAKARSVLISADMAHGEHPSFPDATDPVHVPQLNNGLAVKSSARGNYATGNYAAAWFVNLCQQAEIPLQTFMYRCDHGGGSSVGPIISTGVGICGFDVGAPMIAMHSIRELAGTYDIDTAITAFALVYTSPAEVFSK